MKCKICNNPIGRTRVYCSKDCAKKANKEKSKEYYRRNPYAKSLEYRRHEMLWKTYSDEEQLNLMMLKVKEIMKEWY